MDGNSTSGTKTTMPPIELRYWQPTACLNEEGIILSFIFPSLFAYSPFGFWFSLLFCIHSIDISILSLQLMKTKRRIQKLKGESSFLDSQKKTLLNVNADNNKLYFSSTKAKREYENTVFQFEFSKEIQVQHDSRATATLEIETEKAGGAHHMGLWARASAHIRVLSPFLEKILFESKFWPKVCFGLFLRFFESLKAFSIFCTKWVLFFFKQIFLLLNTFLNPLNVLNLALSYVEQYYLSSKLNNNK